MKYLPHLVYFLIICILFYSLYLYVSFYREHKRVKKLKSLYPVGFLYKNEAYFTNDIHGDLPVISCNHIELLKSIDMSNIEKKSDGAVSLKIEDPSPW